MITPPHPPLVTTVYTHLSIYPQPELVTSNLVEAASKIVQASDVTVV
jgi:hypothetical protein